MGDVPINFLTEPAITAQIIESTGEFRCNGLSNSVARERPSGGRCVWQAGAASLYTPQGGRKYLNQSERQRALEAMAGLAPDQALFAQTLAWCGGRPSEILALSAGSFQVECGIVAIRTLKRRRHCVREVPIPPFLIEALDRHFGLSRRQRHHHATHELLWPWHRVTAWRLMKRVMVLASVAGQRASPRGLRHAFAVATLQSGVPFNLAQRWLGHARISTTAIYAEACGPEEIAFAARFWSANATPVPSSLSRIHAARDM